LFHTGQLATLRVTNRRSLEHHKTFCEDTQLDQHEKNLEKLSEARPYFSSYLYIRSVVYPTSILARIQGRSQDFQLGEADTPTSPPTSSAPARIHVTQIAKEVLKTWLDICALGEKTVGENETIETDLGSSLPSLVGSEIAIFGLPVPSREFGSCGLSEGSSHMVPKEGGTALGWSQSCDDPSLLTVEG
ncbi:red chlorophyll catabolite reductase, chloroplastic, partial [Tanacetum coccineum]